MRVHGRAALLLLAAVLFLLAGGGAAARVAAAADDEANRFGVWVWPLGRDDVGALVKDRPYIRGAFVGAKWSDLEPSDNKFDWRDFDRRLSAAADAGLSLIFIVNVGPASPNWIYETGGVPRVKTSLRLNPRGVPQPNVFPFYLDANYQRYYFRLIRTVAAHVDTLPPRVRAKIIAVQTAEGATGDEGGYKGEPLDKKYVLSEEKWRAFKFETWRLFDRLYSAKKPAIRLAINSGNNGEYNNWLNTNLPHAWRKAGNPGHGYQLNDETAMMAFFDPLINRVDASGNVQTRARSEQDEVFKGWFQENPVWNMYWLHVWNLHFGLDILLHQAPSFVDRRWDTGFAFFSEYAGRKNPATAPGAFCALRDGLDAADTRRFPVATFGAGTFKGRDDDAAIARTEKIAAAFADHGARQGDGEKSIRPTMQNRSATKMNDVGWNIERGNYQRYLTQYDPNGTSVGWWRQGPADQPYGRFARSFDSKAGKTAMFFNLDERFYAGKPPAKPVTVRVVYLDRGTGAWALKYDAASDNEKTALAVTNANTGRWKEATVTLADARFANRCPHGTDLMLVHTGGEDTLFHLIEVKRPSKPLTPLPPSSQAKEGETELAWRDAQPQPSVASGTPSLAAEAEPPEREEGGRGVRDTVGPPEIAASPLPSWQFPFPGWKEPNPPPAPGKHRGPGVNEQGRVERVLRVGDVVFVGGQITTASASGKTEARTGLAALDARTGALLPFAPRFEGGRVRALAASLDGKTLFVGGDFASVNGQPFARLVALDAATGAISPLLTNPAIEGKGVAALVCHGGDLFVGGKFTRVAGQARGDLAKWTFASGRFTLDETWKPLAEGGPLRSVMTLAWDAKRSRIIAAGFFHAISGDAKAARLAALDPASGSVAQTFAHLPNRSDGTPFPFAELWDVAIDGDALYAAMGGPGGTALAYDLASDNSLVLVYVPPRNDATPAAARVLTLDGSASGPTRALWFDPTSGVYQPATLAATVATPGRNAGGDDDWMLVLER